MKRAVSLLLLLSLLFLSLSAWAEPLTLDEDYTGTVTVYYNETDASDGQYVFSYRFPHALVKASGDGSEDPDHPADPFSASVNRFYERIIQEYTSETILNMADYYADMYQDVQVDIDYRITCSTDDYFSVLVSKTETSFDVVRTWEGNTFSRSSGMIGSIASIPNLLNLVESGETDEDLEEFYAKRVRPALCTLIWEKIRENPDHLDYSPLLTRDYLLSMLEPEWTLDKQFYLDENANVVFFFFPTDLLTPEAAEDADPVTFVLTLEQIRDEM